MKTSVSWFSLNVTSHPLRLYCFPYAGGGTSTFKSWQRGMTPYAEVCALQMPGRGVRYGEPPPTLIDSLVDEIAAAVASHDDRPFAFLGHSLGGLLAFETARRLASRGLRQPNLLFVSGSAAPSCRVPHKKLNLLPDDEFIRELRSLNGTPEVLLNNAELMALVLPTLRADFALVSQYVYQGGEAISVPIYVLAGLQDPATDLASAYSWSGETVRMCSVRWFDGDHFFIESHQREVISFVSEEIRKFLLSSRHSAAN